MKSQDFYIICYPLSYFEPLLNRVVEKILVKEKIEKQVEKEILKPLSLEQRMRVNL